MKIIHIIIVVIVVACAFYLFTIVPQPSEAIAKKRIKDSLVGMPLVYSDAEGLSKVYTVSEGSIQSIEKASYKAGAPAWSALIGRNLQWRVWFDSSGTRVLDIEELFNPEELEVLE